MLLKVAMKKYYLDQINKIGNNTYKNWKVIKEFLNQSHHIPDIKEVRDGTNVFSNPTEIANVLMTISEITVLAQHQILHLAFAVPIHSTCSPHHPRK